MHNWRIRKLTDLSVRIDFTGVKAGWEAYVLISSDRHHDNLLCRRDLERADLRRAVELDAPILDFGDLFCAMQGKFDPRKTYRHMRPEYARDDYLNSLIEEAEKYYRPYASNLGVLALGNHETSILNRLGYHLTDELAARLGSRSGNRPPFSMGYVGWVQFNFKIQKTVSQSLWLKWNHGLGKGSEVTKGVTETNRQAVYLPDANIVVNGHTHDAYYVPIARERPGRNGEAGKDLIHFVRTPGYKDEYTNETSGWWIETGKSPRPLGAAFLRFFYEGGKVETEVIMRVR